MEARFVDCHSHVCPSGDDGAQTFADGVALCEEAARRGTRILFATPHVWAHVGPDEAREARVRETFALLAEEAPLELRLGWELTPQRALLRVDPQRYRLGGTDFVLVEVPFQGSADLLWKVAEHVARQGLRPVIAHPERTEAVALDPFLPARLADRGWLLQVNGSSLVGYHGPEEQRTGWRLVESGEASLVASDGHRKARPAALDEAYALAAARIGPRALELFDGTALGLAAEPEPEARVSRASP